MVIGNAASQDDPIASGRDGAMSWWRIGSDRVEMFPSPRGWDVRVRRPGWGGTALDLNDGFATEAEARAWCLRMVAVLAEDLADELL